MARSPTLLRRLERKTRRSLVALRGQRVLAILGMHRSGTSSLAGSLEAAGLYLGDRDVAGSGEWNAKGNRESKVLMRLHEDILRANGGSWDQPPEEVTWSDEHRRTRDSFIRSRSTQLHWGFKDPRALLLLDGWLETLPRMTMVATFRHPAAVARSLQRRAGKRKAGQVSLASWLRLWLVYNEQLLRRYETHGFPIIDFDLPADRYQRRLADVIEQLGLRAPADDGGFFEPSLRHSESGEMELPPAVARTYERLSLIAAAQVDATAAAAAQARSATYSPR